MTAPLIDPFARAITYLRVSVTDRCDFRCVYCMSEDMTFLPKRDLLTLEELDRMCSTFVGLGVEKLRITGRRAVGAAKRDHDVLCRAMSRHLDSRRAQRADPDHQRLAAWNASPTILYAAGVRRVNVSLDTLDEQKFARDHPLGATCRRCCAACGCGFAKGRACGSKSTLSRCKGFNEAGAATSLTQWCAEPGLWI